MVDVYKFLKKNTDVELVWDNQDKQVKFKSSIVCSLEDRLCLSKPYNNSTNFDVVAEFEKLQIVICTEDGVLSGNTNLLERTSNQEDNVFISFPYNNQFCQRRENARIPMHVHFDLMLPDGYLTLKTKNISGKGLACITKEALPDFTETPVTLHMPGGDLQLTCRKVYSKLTDFGNEKLYLNGVEFTDISEENVALIIKDCLKFQMESKHNERLFETL
ncbi:MAG: PilZ domain-containing protein [bacterium]|nr:PilZ domain-containing protein [bacterium]